MSFPDARSGCRKGFLDPRHFPLHVFLASHASIFGQTEFFRGHLYGRQLGPYGAVCDDLRFSLERFEGVRCDHRRAAFFGRDNCQLVSQAYGNVSALVNKPASYDDKSNTPL